MLRATLPGPRGDPSSISVPKEFMITFWTENVLLCDLGSISGYACSDLLEIGVQHPHTKVG